MAAEVLAATAQQPATATLVAAVQQCHDDQVVVLLAENARRLALEPAMPLHQAVAMIGALGIGLALRQTIAPPADSAAILTRVLRTVFPPETAEKAQGEEIGEHLQRDHPEVDHGRGAGSHQTR